MKWRVAYHGTGARRVQSISERGLIPGPSNNFVYAASLEDMACIFAAVRAFEEDQDGLLVQIQDEARWERDPDFPWSLRRAGPIPPSSLSWVVLPRDRLRGYYEMARERKVHIEA